MAVAVVEATADTMAAIITILAITTMGTIHRMLDINKITTMVAALTTHLRNNSINNSNNHRR